MADKSSVMKEAQKYLAKGQIDKAIAEWERLLMEAPDGSVHNIIGDLYLKKGDKKKAAESYRRTADYFRDEGFSLKALAFYKKVLNITPTDADALISLGRLSEEKGLVTDAIRYYLAAADSLSKEGRKDRLLDTYRKILSLSPANIPLRSKVAEIFLREGLTSDAAAEYVHIGRVFLEKGDTLKSRESYQKALDLQPSSRDAVMGMASLLETSGGVQSALNFLKDAAKHFQDDPDMLLLYAQFCMKSGQEAEAKQCLLKAVELAPEDTRPRRLLADMYTAAGQRDRAWTEYVKVIDGMILQERYNEAIDILRSFRDVDPLETGKRLVSLHRQLGDTPQVGAELAALGDALKDRGMVDDALSCYRDAIDVNPDDAHAQAMIAEITAPPAAPPEEPVAAVAPPAEKTADEIFIEADIFSRYGLISEAIKILEGLKVREPHRIDLHMKLKSLYKDASDRESVVTECLILGELYEQSGDTGNAELMLREALEISPDDPRLADKVPVSIRQEAFAAPGEETQESAGEQPRIEDYEEDIAEADFYARQGLVQEALNILERLQAIFPGHRSVVDRLEVLGRISDTPEPLHGPDELEAAASGLDEEIMTGQSQPGVEDEGQEVDRFVDEQIFGQIGENSHPETQQVEDTLETSAEYEEFSVSDREADTTQEMPEPVLDSDVLEVFNEFKKGLERELGEEDSETHYNLGIAYKEMGLIDDAIKEFQVSRSDAKRFLQSSSMLAVCYMEKGLYRLAVDVLNEAARGIGLDDESYWPIRYELAEAYEKNDNLKEALELYTSVYGWNASFRNVSGKVSLLRAQLAKSAEKEKPKSRKDRVSYL